MTNDKRRVKNTLVLDVCLIVIIATVYVASFIMPGVLQSRPVLRGNTGGDNIGLQIAVCDDADVAVYMDMLESTMRPQHFFPEAADEVSVGAAKSESVADASLMSELTACGHSVGVYSADGMYIGGGASVPVMHYAQSGRVAQVAPSIDLTKLMNQQDWTQVLADSLRADMFVYVETACDIGDFEKIVQIVRDKGYTMLKIDEMLK